jgi:cytidylate kinase
MKPIKIAIDGPAGAGKSTVAKKIADTLHYIYIDTGAMYRALAWKAMQDQLDLYSEADISLLLKQIKISLTPNKGGPRVLIDGQDVSEEIRSREVTNVVSFVASHPKIRHEMLLLQRELAQDQGVVMDGRDIGTHVLPNAEAKIFLSASIDERARRRYLELQAKGQETDFEELKEEIRLRDERDSNREVAPLQKAEDAIELDTSGLTIDEVVASCLEIVEKKAKG